MNQLDGVLFTSPSTGQYGNLRINRTNDYDESKVRDMGPVPNIQLPPELTQKRGGDRGGGDRGGGDRGGSSVGPGGLHRGPVPDGPGKMFLGGLPYNLGQDEILQVLAASGRSRTSIWWWTGRPRCPRATPSPPIMTTPCSVPPMPP